MNPYWDILSGKGSPMGGGPLSFTKRHKFCHEYAWAIPDPETIKFVLKHAHGRIVEMGAGTGYWAWQLSQGGADIIAYDKAPPQLIPTNNYHSPKSSDYGGECTGELREIFFDVQPGTPSILSGHTDRTLLLCWPPMSAMAYNSLLAYQGNRVIYIGEGDGGCTASEDFFGELHRKWMKVYSHKIVRWFGLNDRVEVYDRI